MPSSPLYQSALQQVAAHFAEAREPLVALRYYADAAQVALQQLRPGECLACVEEYLGTFEATGMRIAREPRDIREDDPALVLAVEGCDFLEGDLDRLDRLEARGVRSIQLTHYLVNETGDIQTAPPVHGGLTAFWRRGGAAHESGPHYR